MAELKPCPFCGGEPRLERVGDYKQYLIYRCPRCNRTPLNSGDARNYEWEAKRIWNKRAKKVRADNG